MDFNWNEEQQAFREMAADFARDKLAPMAAVWDDTATFPIDVLKEAADLGMAAIVVNENIGGSGLDRKSSAIIFEELATGCISTSAFLSIHNMVTSLVDQYAPEQLRKHWGPKLSRMDVLGSYCLTEPEAGSDAASLKTRAVREGEHYILNGAKAFISGGGSSDVYLCMVRTGDDDYRGISCLLVEKDTPGLSFGKSEKKMGWRNQPTSMIYFENCKVPATNLVGKEGEGFRIALKALNGGRVNIAACSLGGAKFCLRRAQTYLNERVQFGDTLSKKQALRFYFSDMLTQFESARLMVHRAAAAMDNQDEQAPVYCAMAKRLATDVAFQIADKTMQLFGGYGYLADYEIERVFRDLRVHQILEGTNEIMREIIAKASLDEEYEIL